MYTKMYFLKKKLTTCKYTCIYKNVIEDQSERLRNMTQPQFLNIREVTN